MVSEDLYYAFIALGLGFLMWGFDKIIDIVPQNYRRYFTIPVGAVYFVIGVIIIELVIHVGYTTSITK